MFVFAIINPYVLSLFYFTNRCCDGVTFLSSLTPDGLFSWWILLEVHDHLQGAAAKMKNKYNLVFSLFFLTQELWQKVEEDTRHNLSLLFKENKKNCLNKEVG